MTELARPPVELRSEGLSVEAEVRGDPRQRPALLEEPRCSVHILGADPRLLSALITLVPEPLTDWPTPPRPAGSGAVGCRMGRASVRSGLARMADVVHAGRYPFERDGPPAPGVAETGPPSSAPAPVWHTRRRRA